MDDRRLQDLSDHDLLIFLIGDTRQIKKCLNNHLKHHEKANDRLWKFVYIVVGISLTTIVGLIVV